MRALLYTCAPVLLGVGAVAANDCVDCHETVTPGIVGDWKVSAHHDEDVGCVDCHGEDHTSADDPHEVTTVTHETCSACHDEQAEQFLAGKHSKAWAAMNAMPTIHWHPMELIEGQKGCGGCHKIGVKEDHEVEFLKATGSSFGHASCDACHTRHTFSKAEAREPEACITCHMGFDHPQWEMYSTSKHGVRHNLKRQGVLPEEAAAPTCQTCHMAGGNHEVRTAWGFLGVRTDGLGPYPGEDDRWWEDRLTILQGLGVLDPEGQPTERLELVAEADAARLSAEAFDVERDKMIAVCSECHSENFAREELAKGDEMIRETDRLLAKAIRVVAELYESELLEQPADYEYAFPDLLTFHDSASQIENRLFLMYMKHRMRAFQGAFHANPDYSLWYGWSEMVQDLEAIKSAAAELRAEAR
jgi:hypothetical protein